MLYWIGYYLYFVLYLYFEARRYLQTQITLILNPLHKNGLDRMNFDVHEYEDWNFTSRVRPDIGHSSLLRYRAVNGISRNFTIFEEGPYYHLLIESAYGCFHKGHLCLNTVKTFAKFRLQIYPICLKSQYFR